MRNFPIWAEIDLTKLHDNVDIIAKTAGVDLMPVVKANGYGHGALMVAKELSKRADVAALCVWTLAEAEELRVGGVKNRIVVLGGVLPEWAKEVVNINVEPVVGDLLRLDSLKRAAGKEKISVHIKVDTGMRRLGANSLEEASLLFRKASSLKKIRVAGLMTHLADAECSDGVANQQINAFDDFCSMIKSTGQNLPDRHLSNTAAVFKQPKAAYELVRPGIGIYGAQTFGGKDRGLKPIMTLKSKVSAIRKVSKGEGVSYGHTWISPGRRVVAAIWGGYADGYSRRLSNNVSAIICGKKIRQVGTICMDTTLFDVTSIAEKIKLGSEVILIGEAEPKLKVTARDLAKASDTISYEILCGIGRRVPRVYLENGRVKDIKGYVMNGSAGGR